MTHLQRSYCVLKKGIIIIICPGYSLLVVFGIGNRTGMKNCNMFDNWLSVL